VSQTRVKVLRRLALGGDDKRLPLLLQWIFNIGLNNERERERERDIDERERGSMGVFISSVGNVRHV
jgi:hypothetical protein